MDVTPLCRSCMKEVATWEKGNFDRSAVEMFCYCTHIKISDDDKLPKQFCYDCFIKIESSYTFIREAQKANITLKNIVFRDQTSVIVETDSLWKSLSPTAYTPKSVSISLTDYEISKFSNYQEEPLFVQQDSKRDELQNYENARMGTQDGNIVMQDFQDEYNAFTQNHDTHNTSHDTNQDLTTVAKDSISLYKKETSDVSNKSEDKSKNHKCSICQRDFTFKAWLQRHLAKEHTTENKIVCKECNKSFSKPHHLKEHMLSHTASSAFACEQCGARFKIRKLLTAHARRHSEARPFCCGECGARFKEKSRLKDHIQLHSPIKPLLCSVCGRTFAHAGNLKVHMRTHTGAKPYKCNECNFKCSVVSSLRRHEARHSSTPPHRCNFCQKCFYDASALARHTRTHTGSLPYRCAQCGRCFIDSWKRKTHLMRRHQVALHDIPRMDRNGDRII